MGNRNPIPLDVAVVGGGPSGISTCVELTNDPKLKIALFESESELGGMPRSCHIFFGLRDMKRIYTGPAYARRLTSLIKKTSVQVHINSTVIKITPGNTGEMHQLTVSSPEGVQRYHSHFVVLATGCYEMSREARRIPGARSAGIFTTGALQQIVNFRHLKLGKRAIVIGSEHVALSSVLTLKRAGVTIAGLVDEDEAIKTYLIPAKAMSYLYGFPIYKSHVVNSIYGKKRVEGVELVSKKSRDVFEVECDTVICTGKFRPDASLIYNTKIEEDPSSLGPTVDMNLMTTVPNIFAAGNILHGADMHDLCAIEGKQVAHNILKRLNESKIESEEFIRIIAEYPIRYVVPQKILRDKIREHRASWLRPGFGFQVASTIKKPTVEAWSGNEKIWERSYSRLIGNTRTPLPIEKFDWSRLNPEMNVTLIIKSP